MQSIHQGKNINILSWTEVKCSIDFQVVRSLASIQSKNSDTFLWRATRESDFYDRLEQILFF